MSIPSALERQMLDLINAERAARGIDPLTFDRRLNAASEDHSEWIQSTGRFSHAGQGGSSPTERMRDAGFEFAGAWRSAENIAYQSERGSSGYADDVVMLHEGLMRSSGHRANILNPELESVGIGIETGRSALGRFDAVIVTQNFATSSAPNAPYVEFVDVPAPPKPKPLQPGPAAPQGPLVDLPSAIDAALARYQARAEKFQALEDKWLKAGDDARADAWSTRIDALGNAIETWAARQVKQIDRKAQKTADTADDGLADATLAAIADEIETWSVNWSVEFHDIA